jgi:outer membrane murein-binding lipoprotein Lpp
VSRTRRSSLVVAAALVVVVALAGCSSDDNPGSAATVGDQRVSSADVADAVAQVRSELGTTPYDAQKVTTDTVTRMARTLIIDEAATREGIVVTDSQVDALLTSTAKSQGGASAVDQALLTQDSVPASAVSDYARTYLIEQGLADKFAPGTADKGQQAMLSYLSSLSTELGTAVAPRFGTWDAQTLALGALPNDISSPLATPTPSPSS